MYESGCNILRQPYDSFTEETNKKQRTCQMLQIVVIGVFTTYSVVVLTYPKNVTFSTTNVKCEPHPRIFPGGTEGTVEYMSLCIFNFYVNQK